MPNSDFDERRLLFANRHPEKILEITFQAQSRVVIFPAQKNLFDLLTFQQDSINVLEGTVSCTEVPLSYNFLLFFRSIYRKI